MFTLIVLVPLLLHIGNGKGLPAHTCETLPVTIHEFHRIPLIKCCGYDFIKTNVSTSIADHDLQVDIYDKETLLNVSNDQFIVLTRKPCSVVFELNMDVEPWYVQENGFLYHPTVAFEHDNPYTEPGDFCLHPREDSEIVEVHLCVKEVMREQSEKLQSSKHMRFGCVPNTGWIIYTMILTSIYAVLIVNSLRDMLPPSESKLNVVAVFFMRSLFILSEDLRLFLACVHCGKLANVLKEISKNNVKFNSSDIWFGNDSFPRRVWMQIGVGIPLLAARIALSPLLEPKASILVRTTFCIAFLIQYMGCCQFCAYACLLKDLFKLINQSLKQRKAHDLKGLSESHFVLCNAVNDISNTFTIQMLLFNLLLFINILVTLFNSITVFVTIKCENVDYRTTCASLTWLVGYMSVLLSVLQASVNLCDAANSTSDSLHETANEIGKEGGNIYQLSKFSIQMIPIKNEIKVCGMFNLDYQIMLSIIVASTSYLVIMVQFDEGNPCE